MTTTTTTNSQDRVELPPGFDLQGHRGARGLKPENTLPAFEMALDLMVTTLEFDLHFSADDEIVVWHDAVVDPSKCGLRDGAPLEVPDPDDSSVSEQDLAVRSLTAEQLSWYQCDRNPDRARFIDQDAAPTPLAGDDYSIATLNDLLEFVDAYAMDETRTEDQRKAADSVQFNMETKRKKDPATIGDGFDGENAGPFELGVLEIVDERGIADRTTVQSFDIRSLRAIRAIDNEISLSFLESRSTAALADLAAWGIDVWSPNYVLATPDKVAEAQGVGLAVKPWTIESMDQATGILDAGVDGLITDRPDLFSVDP